MLNRVHLIFSGFNQRAIIAFIRTLTETERSFAIIAKSKEDPILLTEYKRNVYSVRKRQELDMEDIKSSINEVKNAVNAERFIIAPSTEALNRFVIDKVKQFESLNCYSPLVNKDLYELISDKYSFGELCIQNGIDVPFVYDSFNEAKIPFVAKPIKYFSGGNKVYNPILILSNNDKISFLENYNSDDFYFQEFVTGKSLYLLYYFHRNGTNYKYSQENIVQQPNGKSIIAAISSDFHLSLESFKYEMMLKKINYYGFIMIEVRKSKAKNYMIEANPRFWGPSQLFVDADKNLFKAYLNDFDDLPLTSKFFNKIKRTKYFWFGGFLEAYKNGNRPVFHQGAENSFLSTLNEWLKYDIYNRKDTVEIFKDELK
jgi:hypothetical protein